MATEGTPSWVVMMSKRGVMATSTKGAAWLGYAAAIIQAAFYSTMGIFGKLLYATGMDAQSTVILRFTCTTIILGIFMLIWRKQPLISRQKSVYLQAVFFFISSCTYFFAVESLTAGMTTVIFYMYPVAVAVISLFAFHEKLSGSTVIALVVSIAGLIFISGIINGELVLDPVGILFAIIACLAFAIYTVLIQKTGRSEESFTVTFTLSWTSLLASCIVFAPSVPGMFSINAYQIGIGCLIALLNTILPIVLYIVSVKRIGGTKASLLGISETPFSLGLAYLILGEQLTVLQAIGATLIVLGIAIITIAPILSSKKTAEAQPLDSEMESEES